MATADSRLEIEFPQGIPADANCFDGHFPDNPIVPGAVLLGFAAEYLANEGFEIARVNRMKFVRPLFPDQSFAIEFAIHSDTATVTWMSSETVLATARILLRVHGS